MRIALVSPRYAPDRGGIETLVRAIGERMASCGHQVDVLTLSRHAHLPAHEELQGVHIRRFREHASTGVFYVGLGLLGYLLKYGQSYDVVNAHNYHALPLFWASLTGAQRLVASPHYHGGGHTTPARLLHPAYRPFGRWAMQRARRVVCASQAEQSLVEEHLGVSAAKITLVPDGIRLGAFRSAEPLAVPGIPLLYVGRLEHYKRVDQAIAAMPALPPDYHLYVIGQGPEEAALKQQAQAIEMGSRVTFLGNVPDGELARWYRSARVLVMLSNAESFPMTTLEALAAGCQAVCGPSAPFQELAQRFPEDIRIAEETTPHALSEHIATMAGRPGRAAVPLDEYDWDNITRTMLRIFSL